MALIIAAALRFGMLWFVDVKLVNDAATYDLLAQNLLTHGVFSSAATPPFTPSAYRPPLYPALLALVNGAFGHARLPVQLCQILLSLGSIYLLFICARKLQAGTERWVLWFLTLSPFDAVYTVVFLSEGLTSFLLSLGMVAWSTLQPRLRWILLGAAFGLATLCRDIYIALPPFFAAMWFVWGTGSARARVRAGTVLVLTSLIIVAPWSVRNALVLEKWAPVSSGRLGFSLWTGAWAVSFANVKEKAGGRVYPPEAYLDSQEERQHTTLLASADANALDRFYIQSFVRRMRHEPIAVVGRWFQRAPLLWIGTRFDIFDLNVRALPYGTIPWYICKGFLFVLNGLCIVLGFFGMVLSWTKRSRLRWLSVPIIFTAAVYFPLNSFENRYSQPVYMLLLVFAAVSARGGYLWLRSRAALEHSTEQTVRTPSI